MISAPGAGMSASGARHTVRRRRLVAVFLLLAVALQAGCGAIQKPGWRKPWGKGTWIPALVCGAIGAGVGVAIQNERPGCSTITIDGKRFRDCDDEDLWKGAVIGAPSSVSWAFGRLLSMRTTEVNGRRSTVVVLVRPDESRTVRTTR